MTSAKSISHIQEKSPFKASVNSPMDAERYLLYPYSNEVSVLQKYAIPNKRFAVILNANAGRVTPRLTRSIKNVVPSDQVHLSQSPEHAKEILHKCVEREVSTVFAGGGDGTIVHTINQLEQFRGDAPHIPDVGVLSLGTGNALARWLGSGKPVRDLARWQGGMIHRTVPVHMVEAEDTLFPFAGMGHDAAVLNDYNWLKGKAKGTWWESITYGIRGYMLAGFAKTIPNYLQRPTSDVIVTNVGRPAHRIGLDGNEIGSPIPTGEILYEGPCSMIGSATTPLLGYGMRLFPHAAKRAGRFHLRLLNLSAFESALNFPAAWNGTLDHERCFDFYADRVRINFSDAMPYQLAGEAKGFRKELTFSLTNFPVNLVAQA